MGDRVTIGVLGGNSWIANAAVIPAIRASRYATLGSVGSRRGPLSYDDVLADPANDAVYIALANGLHLEWVRRAAEHGKHVLCEKPLALTHADVEDMYQVCAGAGVLLAEAYMTPFHPRSREIARRVDAGCLGQIQHIDAAFTFPLTDLANYRWLPEQGGGALLDVGIYCLSPIVAAFGAEPERIDASSIMSASGVDLTTSVRLQWANGSEASVVVSFELPERQWLRIAGADGVLIADQPFTPGPHDDSFEISTLRNGVERCVVPGGNCYELMIDAFAQAVHGATPWPRPIAEVVALASLHERIAESARVIQ